MKLFLNFFSFNIVKFLSLLAFFFVSVQNVFSNECSMFGISKADVEKQMAKDLKVDEVIVDDYGRAAARYNPVGWIIDWNRDYRILSFTIKHKGKTQSFSDCSANYTRDDKQVIIAACSGDVALRHGRGEHYALTNMSIDLSSITCNEHEQPTTSTAARNDARKYSKEKLDQPGQSRETTKSQSSVPQ